MKKLLKNKSKIEIQLEIEKFIFEQLWQHLTVIAFVVFCGWIFDRYIVSAMFCISHVIIRKNFDKQYHCGTTAVCLVTTLSIAFFGIMSCFPLSVSLLSVIPVCFCISWVGYLAQDRIDLVAYNKKLKEQTTQTEMDKFIAKCKALNYNQLKTQIAIKFFIEKQTPKDVWYWLQETQENPVEWDSVRKMKYRMKKDLFG